MTNLLRECPDGDGALEEAIDWEHRREVYRQASSIVRAEVSQESWQVFSMTVIDGLSAGFVAQQLNKSVGAVYVARCRTIARLREVARTIEEDT